jgi:hypothetical protein
VGKLAGIAEAGESKRVGRLIGQLRPYKRLEDGFGIRLKEADLVPRELEVCKHGDRPDGIPEESSECQQVIGIDLELAEPLHPLIELVATVRTFEKPDGIEDTRLAATVRPRHDHQVFEVVQLEQRDGSEVLDAKVGKTHAPHTTCRSPEGAARASGTPDRLGSRGRPAPRVQVSDLPSRSLIASNRSGSGLRCAEPSANIGALVPTTPARRRRRLL